MWVTTRRPRRVCGCETSANEHDPFFLRRASSRASSRHRIRGRRLRRDRGGGRRAGVVGIRLLISEDLQQGIEWRYDVSRINELRRMDVFYRLFQPAIQLLARLNRKVFADGLSTIYREIQAAGLPRSGCPKNTWPSCN